VAWLTVSEAAERLEISEAAVRKRMQRNTLKHSKWADGRVYVHVPAGKDDEKDAGTQKSEDTNQARGSWWDYAAGASGLLVALSLMIYVLGLFALWAPIMRTYTHNAVTAWHAVSLVPRPVVAGLGMRQLVAFPLLTALTLLTLVLVVYYGFRALRNRFGTSPSHEAEEDSQDAEEREPAYVGLGLAMVSVYGLVLLYAGWRIGADLAPLLGVSPWRLALSVLVLLVIALSFVLTPLSFFLAMSEFRRRKSVLIAFTFGMLFWLAILVILFYVTLRSIMEPKLLLQNLRAAGADYIIDAVIVFAAALIVMFLAPAGGFIFIIQLEDNSLDRGLFLLGLAMVLVPAFLAAFMLTFVSDPPLAAVDVDGSPGVEGTLLTHVDGYWHVFNKQGNLVAIPDDKVSAAEICAPGTAKTANTCAQDK
jgi:hypothetical protein